MGHLIETLHGLRKIEKDKGTPDWVYFVIGAVIALLIVIASFIYCKRVNISNNSVQPKGGVSS